MGKTHQKKFIRCMTRGCFPFRIWLKGFIFQPHYSILPNSKSNLFSILVNLISALPHYLLIRTFFNFSFFTIPTFLSLTSFSDGIAFISSPFFFFNDRYFEIKVTRGSFSSYVFSSLFFIYFFQHFCFQKIVFAYTFDIICNSSLAKLTAIFFRALSRSELSLWM